MGTNSILTLHKVVVPGCAVIIAGVIFCADDPPFKGEERFEDWSDETWEHFWRLLMDGCLKYVSKIHNETSANRQISQGPGNHSSPGQKRFLAWR